MSIAITPYSTGTGLASVDTPAQNTASPSVGSSSASQLASKPSVSITLSDAAQAALTASSQTFSSIAQDARAKLDADYAKAKADGTRIVSDISKGGRFLDVSSLSAQELAAVKLNKDGLFTKEEGLTAWAELGQRLKASLAPFEPAPGSTDMRAYQTGVQQLYKGMSQEVRDALGWNQSVLDMSKKVVAASEEEYGKLDQKSFLQKFIAHLKELQTSTNERALDVDTSRFAIDGQDAATDLTASSQATSTSSAGQALDQIF